MSERLVVRLSEQDAKIEAKVHAIGLLMFLTLIAVVTYTEVIPKRQTTEETAKPAPK